MKVKQKASLTFNYKWKVGLVIEQNMTERATIRTIVVFPTALDSSSWMLWSRVVDLQPLLLGLQLCQGLPVLEVGQLARVEPGSKGLDVRDHGRVQLLQGALPSLPLSLLTHNRCSEHG